MATPTIRFTEGSQELMNNVYRSVLEILARYDSMPFLELTSLTDIDDGELGQIIDHLEREGIVKVSNRDNILEEVITLRDKTFSRVASAQ